MTSSPFDSLDEIRRRHTVRHPHLEVREKFTLAQRFACWVSNWVGTTYFCVFLAVAITVWIVEHKYGTWQLDEPEHFFGLMSLVLNVFQILLLPLILAGQNVQAREADASVKYDTGIDRKAEKEIDVVVQQLENQTSMLKALLDQQRTTPRSV